MKKTINRDARIRKYISYWQAFLNLTNWEIDCRLVDFKRKDKYNQSGDIQVDIKKKKATVLLKKEETGKDSSIILHELIHLVLWDMDAFVDKSLPPRKKDEYLGHLEDAVSRIEKIMLEKDREK